MDDDTTFMDDDGPTIATESIPKPQEKFVPKPDNSEAIFVPIVKHKFNAVVPLETSPKQHPYLPELETFQYLAQQLTVHEPIQKPQEGFNVQYISVYEDLVRLCKILSGAKEFAVDTEQHCLRSYQGFTCLMQISTRTTDYLVDAIELRQFMWMLNEAFTNPTIIKVMHGSREDVEWIQRDFGLYIVNLFDTSEAAKALGYSSCGLSFLLKKFVNINTDKMLRLADWRKRPLSMDLEHYAVLDTHYLLYFYDTMRQELLRVGRNKIVEVLDASRELCKRTYEKKQVPQNFKKDVNFKRGYDQYASEKRKQNAAFSFSSKQNYIINALYKVRDRIARKEDEGVKYVMKKDLLFDCALATVANVDDLVALAQKYPDVAIASVRKYSEDIIMAIREAEHEFTQNSSMDTTLEDTLPQSNPCSVHQAHGLWDENQAFLFVRDFCVRYLNAEPVVEEKAVGPDHDIRHRCKITVPLLPAPLTVMSDVQRKKKDAVKVASANICSRLIELGLLQIKGHPSERVQLETTATTFTATEMTLMWQKQDSKNILIYTLQKHGINTPLVFNVTQDKAKVFHAILDISSPITCRTEGAANSKKEAELEAACRMCVELQTQGKLEIPDKLKKSSSTTVTEKASPKRKSDDSLLLQELSHLSLPIAEVQNGLEYHLVCNNCRAVFCPEKDVVVTGSNLTVTDAAWTNMLQQGKVYIEPNLKPKAYNPYKVHCQSCRRSLGSVSKGGMPCFKSSSNYFQTLQQVPAGITCADWRKIQLDSKEVSAPVSQAQKRLKSAEDKIALGTVLQAESRSKHPNDTAYDMYTYSVEFQPSPEKVAYPHLNGMTFEGFILFSPQQFHVTDFRLNSAEPPSEKNPTICLTFCNKMGISQQEMEQIKGFYESFFYRFTKQKEVWNLATSCAEFPLFFIPSFTSRQLNADIVRSHITMLPQLTIGTPLLPALQSSIGKYSFTDVRNALIGTTSNATVLCATVQQINESLRGRTVRTTYNEDLYIISGVSFLESPATSFDDKTFKEYVSQKYNKATTDDYQPLLVVTANALTKGNMGSSQGPRLIPEFCDLIGFTTEMRLWGGDHLPYIAKHIRQSVAFMNKLALWQQSVVTIRDPVLLTEVFTHADLSKATNVRSEGQRLEFLGDSVLDFVTSVYVYRANPTATEGRLSDLKINIICNRNLHQRALHLKMDQFIRSSHTEPIHSDKYLSDHLEILIGVLFLENGLFGAASFINDYVLDQQMNLEDLKGAFALSAQEKETLPVATQRFELLKPEVERFCSTIGYKFVNKELFIQALTHKSLANHSSPYNALLERLEFLGDSFLKFMAGIHFYGIKPDAQEGDLSAYRANFVQNVTLGKKCKEIGLDRLLLYNDKMMNLEEHTKTYGDVFESLVGAIFADRGLDLTKKDRCPCSVDIFGNFVHRFLLNDEDPTMLVDYKGTFASCVIHLYPGVLPEYKVLAYDGNQVVVGVYVNGREIAKGSSKKHSDAERIAAMEAVKLYNSGVLL